MSRMRTEFPTTEGILLIRQDGRTMAVHLTAVTAILEAIIVEHPNLELPYATFYGPSTFDHYAVEATGRADRIFLWEGRDPFARPEIEATRAEVEA